MDKKQNYYGEVWFPDNEKQKCFCVLSFDDDQILLTTNLVPVDIFLKTPNVNKILGVFNVLGCFSFFDCLPINCSYGLITHVRYKPKYSFNNMNSSFIINDYKQIKTKKIFVQNDTIIKWMFPSFAYNSNQNKLTIDMNEKTVFYKIDEIKLKITIRQYPHFRYKRSSDYVISNIGCLDFEFKDSKSIYEMIDIYYKFKKILFFVFGEFERFREFKFYLLREEKPIRFFINDREICRTPFSLVEMEYKEIKTGLLELLKSIYTNKDFLYCLNQLMENHISEHITVHQKFITSIISYEAFYHRFGIAKNITLKQKIKKNKCVFKKIKEFDNLQWEKFVAKVVDTRTNYVHGIDKKKEIFSDSLDLIGVSFLFDSVIAYSLLKHTLKELKDKEEILDRYAGKSKQKLSNFQKKEEF